MTAAVQQLLNSFDALPHAEQQQAAIEILRRVAGPSEGDLPDAALVEAAEALFSALDEEEASHAER
jgi:hypothetical protein